MKRLAIALALTAIPGTVSAVPIETDAVISDTADFPRATLISLADPGASMIRLKGWRCDSVSAIRPHLFSRGFTMVCNNFRYTYEFKDRGGNWVVNLK